LVPSKARELTADTVPTFPPVAAALAYSRVLTKAQVAHRRSENGAQRRCSCDAHRHPHPPLARCKQGKEGRPNACCSRAEQTMDAVRLQHTFCLSALMRGLVLCHACASALPKQDGLLGTTPGPTLRSPRGVIFLGGTSFGSGLSWRRPHAGGGPWSAPSRGQERARALARRCGIRPTLVRPTRVRPWRTRQATADRPMGPAEPPSTGRTLEQEAVIVAVRPARALAARQPPLRAPALDPGPDALIPTPLPSAPRHPAAP